MKSQTSKGMAELQKLLGTEDTPQRMHAGIAGGGVTKPRVTRAGVTGTGGRDR